jgi:divalent metal cation (Fe/Co/Zn/Cd) transporter
MEKEKKSFLESLLESLAGIIVVFVILAVFYHTISEWIKYVKDPKTRIQTLISTIICIIIAIWAYNHFLIEKKNTQPNIYEMYEK